MTREEKIKAFAMRLDGATFQEIADKFSVSWQAVQMALDSKMATRVPPCRYPGLKRWMETTDTTMNELNERLQLFKGAITMYKKMRGEVRFTIDEIKKILAYTDLTFEEAFGEEIEPGGDSDA